MVRRNNGQTLRNEYGTAVASSPDVLGLISWNEFSENSYVEPSQKFGRQYLDVLHELRGTTVPPRSPSTPATWDYRICQPAGRLPAGRAAAGRIRAPAGGRVGAIGYALPPCGRKSPAGNRPATRIAISSDDGRPGAGGTRAGKPAAALTAIIPPFCLTDRMTIEYGATGGGNGADARRLGPGRRRGGTPR